MAEDAVKAAPNVYRTLLENDRVRVLESRLGPGDKTAVHSHPDLVAIPLTDAKVRFTSPDGQTAEAELTAGGAAFFPATEHTTENIGATEGVVLLVELK